MKNKQKWLTSKIKGEWKDKDFIIEIALFESLIHYVEKEGGLEYDAGDWSFELKKGYITQEEADEMEQRVRELRETYTYLKEERPKMVKEVDEWGTDRIEEFLEIEKALYDRDTQAMFIIVKHRGTLWT